MNLTKLFDTQRTLDERIVREKGLEGRDLLSEKILALQVELGELANELPEVFKFWSNKKNDYEKALKEYVDCLHFVITIGLEKYKYGHSDDYALLPIGWIKDQTSIKYENVTKQFNYLFNTVGYLMDCTNDCELGSDSEIEEQYENVFRIFIGLGEMLGFTWKQVSDAYMLKNAINHERQNTGY